jgi:hypothetical protein
MNERKTNGESKAGQKRTKEELKETCLVCLRQDWPEDNSVYYVRRNGIGNIYFR